MRLIYGCVLYTRNYGIYIHIYIHIYIYIYKCIYIYMYTYVGESRRKREEERVIYWKISLVKPEPDCKRGLMLSDPCLWKTSKGIVLICSICLYKTMPKDDMSTWHVGKEER